METEYIEDDLCYGQRPRVCNVYFSFSIISSDHQIVIKLKNAVDRMNYSFGWPPAAVDDRFSYEIEDSCRFLSYRLPSCDMSVIVLSERYVSSLQCMVELQQIFQSSWSHQFPIFLVFCHIQPEDLLNPANLMCWKLCWAEESTSLGPEFDMVDLDISSWPGMLQMLGEICMCRTGKLAHDSTGIIQVNKERIPYQSNHDYIQAMVCAMAAELSPPNWWYSLDFTIKRSQRMVQDIESVFSSLEDEFHTCEQYGVVRAIGVHGSRKTTRQRFCQMMLKHYENEFRGRCYYIEFSRNQDKAKRLYCVGSPSTNLVNESDNIDEAFGILEKALQEHKLFLAIDNVDNDVVSFDFVKKIMQLMNYKYSGSKTLVTSRSKKILIDLFQCTWKELNPLENPDYLRFLAERDDTSKYIMPLSVIRPCEEGRLSGVASFSKLSRRAGSCWTSIFQSVFNYRIKENANNTDTPVLDIKAITQALDLNEESKMSTLDTVAAIGVHGVGGSGKTTLCKMLVNHFARERQYCDRSFCVEFPCNDDEVAEKLLHSITLILSRLSASSTIYNCNTVSKLDKAMDHLQKELQRTVVFLAIDNVWGHEDSEHHMCFDYAKRLMLTSFKRGSRILVTSRSKKVLTCLLQSRCLAMKYGEHTDHLPARTMFGSSIVHVPSLTRQEAVEVLRCYSGVYYPDAIIYEPDLESLADSCISQDTGLIHPAFLKLKGLQLKTEGRISFKGQDWRDLIQSMISNDIGVDNPGGGGGGSSSGGRGGAPRYLAAL